MTYIIAIPSYKRSSIVQQKTLTTLKNLGIPKEVINIFVTEEEYTDYQDKCNPDFYGNIIVGAKGLVQQRQFINNFFPPETKIISLDDDIESLDLSMTNYASADEFFKTAFEICMEQGAYIWGLYPVFNPFFRKSKEPITTHLNFIIGAFFGYINRPTHSDLDLDIATQGNKEDVERTIKYWKKDGVVIRFNQIGFKTKYYGNDGGGLGKFNDRLEMMKQNAIAINAAYPDITKIKIRKTGMYEIVFKATKSKPIMNKEPIVIMPKVDESLFKELLDLLKNHCVKMCDKRSSRLNFGKHRSEQYGIVRARFSGIVGLSQRSKKNPEIYSQILKIGEAICPFKFGAVQLNNNTVCPPHYDSANVGSSMLISFGDYTGCNIVIEGIMYDAKYSPIIFNGSERQHWNTNDLQGNKYSLVFYTIKEIKLIN
jgi:hypothetical protein